MSRALFLSVLAFSIVLLGAGIFAGVPFVGPLGGLLALLAIAAHFENNRHP